MRIVFDDYTGENVDETEFYRILNSAFNNLGNMRQKEGRAFPPGDEKAYQLTMSLLSRIDLISMKRDMAGGNPRPEEKK